jgi:Tol biopolymer transport system component
VAAHHRHERLDGRILAVQELVPDCVDSCAPQDRSYFRLWISEAGDRFRRLGKLGAGASIVGPVPTISPNARWLAYGTRRHGLVVQRLDMARSALMGAPRPIAMPGRRSVISVGWSPDNRKLVLVAADGGSTDVWVVNRGGSAPRRIVCGCVVKVSADPVRGIPAWSRQNRIAFVGDQPVENGVTRGIYVVDATGDDLRELTRPIPVPDERGFVYVFDTAPSWSPSGREIVFSRDRRSYDRDLRVVDVRTGVMRRLGRKGGSGVFSPNGGSIAYLASGVAIVPSAGEGRRRDLRMPYGLWAFGFIDRLQWLGP